MIPRRRRGKGLSTATLVAWTLALVSCGGDPSQESSPSPTPKNPPAVSEVLDPGGPPKDVASACGGQVGAILEEPLELPEDLRIAARIDLRDPGVESALEHLEAWARADPSAGTVRPPTVAGLALSQIGFQVGHIRALLGGLGIDPPELLLLQGPGGELVWVWRLPCDHERLRELVKAGWELRIRTLVAGALGEPADPQRFPFDLLFLPGERLALVPAGGGMKLLRWLTDGGPRVPALGAPQAEDEVPSELLGRLAPAAIRLVIADRVGGTLTLRPASNGKGALRVRAEAAGLEISDSLPTPP